MDRLTINTRDLIKESGKTSYRVAKDGELNYPTLHRWMSTDIKAFKSVTLLGILRGVGYSDKEILDLRLGDIFEIEAE